MPACEVIDLSALPDDWLLPTRIFFRHVYQTLVKLRDDISEPAAATLTEDQWAILSWNSAMVAACELQYGGPSKEVEIEVIESCDCDLN